MLVQFQILFLYILHSIEMYNIMIKRKEMPQAIVKNLNSFPNLKENKLVVT